MASAEQIKLLIKAHLDQDNEKFKTAVLQIAAYEAKLGHMKLAHDLKAVIDKADIRTKILQMNTQNQMLSTFMPSERISDLVVSEDVQERISRILSEFSNRKKLKKFGLINRRKILIEGSPGTGKTMTASVIAAELNLPLFTVQMDKMVTKYMGETSVKLRQVFDSIENITGVYLFDEFDAIGADRGMDNEVGEMRRILNSFLQFIEQDLSESIIIAATNNQRILDRALFRRFDDVLHYSLPTENDIEELMLKKLAIYAPIFKPSSSLVKKMLSLSHAEISRICDDAIKGAVLSDSKLTEQSLTKLADERLAVYVKEVL